MAILFVFWNELSNFSKSIEEDFFKLFLFLFKEKICFGQ
jgi:hypothetical protein